MTAPIQFPSIAPAQSVQRPSPLAGFGELMTALIAQRQNIALRKRQLDVEEQQARASIGESEARTKTMEEELRVARLDLDANNTAFGELMQTVRPTSEGGVEIDPSEIASAIERIGLNKDKEHSALALRKFSALVKGEVERSTAVTEGQRARTAATVEAETAPARIEAGKLAPEQARTNIAANRAAEQQARDASVAQLFGDWRTSGRSWGEVATAHNKPPNFAGIAPTTKFEPLTNGIGGGGEVRSRAIAALPVLLQSAATIEAVQDRAKGLKVLGQLQSGLNRVGFDATVNAIQDADQQTLISSHRAFVRQYNFVISGATTPDKEFVSILGSIAELDTDKEQTKRSKRTLLRTMVSATIAVSSGKTSPMQAAQLVLLQAKASKAEPAVIAALTRMQEEARLQAGTGVLPTTPDEGSQPFTIDSVPQTVSDVLRSRGYKP